MSATTQVPTALSLIGDILDYAESGEPISAQALLEMAQAASARLEDEQDASTERDAKIRKTCKHGLSVVSSEKVKGEYSNEAKRYHSILALLGGGAA